VVQPPTARKARLPGMLAKLQLPRVVYIPLCSTTDNFARIIRIPLNEVGR
jgi:hypothetical protein